MAAAMKILIGVCLVALCVAIVAFTLFWIGRQAYRTFTGWEKDKQELLEIYETVKTERNKR